MLFRKIIAIILERKLIKEKDALVFILSEKEGVLKLYSKSSFIWSSKNVSLLQPGNLLKLWIMSDIEKMRLISGLPLKIPSKIFHKYPYFYLWTLRLIRIFNLRETPPKLWEIVNSIDDYLKENPKNFIPWFVFKFLEEIGFGLDFKFCQCGRILDQDVFWQHYQFVCKKCKKPGDVKIDENILKDFKKLKSEKPPKGNINKEIHKFLKERLKLAKSLL